MKIAIEAQRLFRPRKHGMDVVAYELLRRLPVSGDRHDYHVLVKDDADKCITHAGSRTVHTMRSAPYPVWEQALLPQYCNKVKADVLHCTANTAPLKTKQPLVLTLHDVIFIEQSYAKASQYQRLGNFYRSTIVPSIAKKATRVITVSQYQKNIIADKLSIPEEKISVIYNGADERFFKSYSKHEIKQVLDKYKLKEGYNFFHGEYRSKKKYRRCFKSLFSIDKEISISTQVINKRFGLRAIAATCRARRIATSYEVY